MTRFVAAPAALAITLAFVTSACSGSSNKPSPSTTSSAPVTSPSSSPSAADTGVATEPGVTTSPAVALPVPITNARAARDILLQAAKGKEDQGFPDGWHGYEDGLTFAGSLVPADATHVSGFNFVFSKSKDASYLAFAVSDTMGACAGGLLLDDNTTYSNIVSANPVEMTNATKCDGQTVADIAGYLS